MIVMSGMRRRGRVHRDQVVGDHRDVGERDVVAPARVGAGVRLRTRPASDTSA